MSDQQDRHGIIGDPKGVRWECPCGERFSSEAEIRAHLADVGYAADGYAMSDQQAQELTSDERFALTKARARAQQARTIAGEFESVWLAARDFYLAAAVQVERPDEQQAQQEADEREARDEWREIRRLERERDEWKDALKRENARLVDERDAARSIALGVAPRLPERPDEEAR